jgi:hypothetical protein
MVKERRRLGTSEETRQLNLAAGRFQEIVAADDQVHALDPVIDDRCEVIRPVAGAIPHQQIAALIQRLLRLRTMAPIVEPLQGRLQPDSEAQAGRLRQALVGARAGISELVRDGLKTVPYISDICRYLSSGAAARVDETAAAQLIERRFIQAGAIALPYERSVSDEPEPREIFEDPRFEGRPAAVPIVILDAQQHLPLRSDMCA